MAEQVVAGTLIQDAATERGQRVTLKVLAVIPHSGGPASMIFAKRQVAAIQGSGIACESFLLSSRTSPIRLWMEYRRFRTLVKDFQPDVVHAHFGTVTALFTAFVAQVPIVITFRGSDLNPAPGDNAIRSWIGRVFSQLAALRAARIICVSDQIRDRLWWRRERTAVIPSGVDTKLFFARPRNEARARLGWPEAEQVVVFNAGSNPVGKRLDLARLAAAEAEKICGPIRLMVLTGQVPPTEMPFYLSAADSLLFTSDWEGSPNVVKEALACGLPVVSVDVGDVRKRISGCRHSRVVERSPGALGGALAEVIMAKAREHDAPLMSEVSDAAIAAKISAIYGSIKPAVKLQDSHLP